MPPDLECEGAIGYNLGSPGGRVEDVVIRGLHADDDMALGLLASEGALASMERVAGGATHLDVTDVRIGGPADETGADGEFGAFCHGSTSTLVVSDPCAATGSPSVGFKSAGSWGWARRSSERAPASWGRTGRYRTCRP